MPTKGEGCAPGHTVSLQQGQVGGAGLLTLSTMLPECHPPSLPHTPFHFLFTSPLLHPSAPSLPLTPKFKPPQRERQDTWLSHPVFVFTSGSEKKPTGPKGHIIPL